MVRWDSPLFTVPWSEADMPVELIWKAITEGNVKPPNVGTQGVGDLPRLVVFSALLTFYVLPAQVPKAPSDALHTLESVSMLLVRAIIAEQGTSGVPGGHVTLSLSENVKPQVRLPARILTLSELQRMKRQFVTVQKKAITLGTVEKGLVDWSEESVAQKFVDYLEENI